MSPVNQVELSECTWKRVRLERCGHGHAVQLAAIPQARNLDARIGRSSAGAELQEAAGVCGDHGLGAGSGGLSLYPA